MRKKVDYAKLNQNAVKNLKKINELAKEFSKYESIAGVKKEIDGILKDSNASKYKNDDRNGYLKITNAFARIEDALGEIDLLTSNAIKNLNKLPEEARKEIYYTTGIDEVEESDQGISEGRAELLERMLALVEEIMEESARYFNLDREEYVEFEDEIKEL
ncbi:hypothetical protein HYU10_05470 [Candidatus Woesearchaeota archaeon]|nr:hypothetical protein [Candidatus Woesearchaeota archaeon]